MIRLLLVDDHASFLRPLAFMLEREPDLSVVAQARSLAEARACLGPGADVDVALVDIQLPDGNGLDLIGDLRAANADALTIVLTGALEPKTRALAVDAGAAAVLDKGSDLPEIVAAIRRLGAGQAVLSPVEMVELLREAGRIRAREQREQAALTLLTPREREIVQALVLGLDNEGIARRLQIRPETVRTHVVNVLGKLGVESRLQAVLLALRHGAATLE